VFSPDSLRTGTLNAACGHWFRQHGKQKKAEPYFREAIRIYRTHENPPRDYYLAALDGLFQLVRRQEDTSEAISVFHELMENMTYVVGPDHLLIAPNYFEFARALQARGRDADAIPLLIEGIRISRQVKGQAWEDAAKRLDQLAQVTRRVAPAAGLANEQYQAALEGATTLSIGHSDADSYAGLVGIVHYRLGNYEEAIKYLTPTRELSEHETHNVLRERAFLAMTQFQLGKPEAARGTLAEAREMMELETLAEDKTNRAVVSEAESLISPEEDSG